MNVKEMPPTPLAIIDAAEELFGKHGLEGVSLRSIYAAAGISNKSAVTYYFGDRHALIMAIWQYRLPVLEIVRRRMLEEARIAGTLDDPCVLVRLLVQPIFELTDKAGGHNYASFFKHALRAPAIRQLRTDTLSRTDSSVEIMERLVELAPVPRDELVRRVRIMVCAFCDMVVDRDADIAAEIATEPVAEFLQDAAEMIAGACWGINKT